MNGFNPLASVEACAFNTVHASVDSLYIYTAGFNLNVTRLPGSWLRPRYFLQLNVLQKALTRINIIFLNLALLSALTSLIR